MSFQVLLGDIASKKASVGIIGLGYVGLPLAILASVRGYNVSGLLRTTEKVKRLSQGETDVDTIKAESLKKVLKSGTFVPRLLTIEEIEKNDIIIICVPTPVTQKKTPDLAPIKSVATMLSQANLSGKLVINESTVAPGSTRELFSFLKSDSYLACSPERVDPGNSEKHVSQIAKVVGGRDPKSLELATAFYKNLLDANVVQVSTLEATEMAKMLENTYRAVNIALINEIALLCETLHIDVLEVIRAASTKWSFQAHFPSIGVGGHCIPVDPYYIVELAKRMESPMTVVPAALSRNNSMPSSLFRKLRTIYKKGMSVLVYGLTYKKDIADTRESPALAFCEILKEASIPFTVYDPHLSDKRIGALGLVKGRREPVEILVIGTDHKELSDDKAVFISKDTLVLDGRNTFIKKMGAKVIGVGRTLV